MLWYRGTLCCGRQNIYLLVGLLIGICLSVYDSRFLSSRCSSKNMLFYGSKSLFQNLDDIEPQINLAGKPMKALKLPQTLLRPRYFYSELGIRQKLFVAVLTSENTIGTLGVALNKTVAHLVDKLMFFTNIVGHEHINISMFKLSSVVGFTDTRPSLKPFHLLKYLVDNFLEEYDMFLILKDSTYVNAGRFYDSIRKISASEILHAGSSLKSQSSFCSLDAGILLTNQIVRKVQDSLNWCVKSTFSDSDDDNFGRCILRATQIPCNSSIQGFSYWSYDLLQNNITKELNDYKNESSFHKSFLYYPITKPEMFYKLHLYFSKESVKETIAHMSSLARDFVGNKKQTDVPTQAVVGRFDILRWDYFTERIIYFSSELSNVKALSGVDLKDIIYIINLSISWLEEKYNGEISKPRLVNGYRRFDPSSGLEYLLDFSFTDLFHGEEVHKRLKVLKHLGDVELLPVPYVTENNRVHIILPVQPTQLSEAKWFIEQYEQHFMQKRENTILMMVLQYDWSSSSLKNDVFKDLKALALFLSNRFQSSGKIVWLSIKLPNSAKKLSPFYANSLDFAMVDLVLKKFPAESLMLISQSNSVVRQDYLNRVRMNTISQWQVFSPIPFSAFNPEIVFKNNFSNPDIIEINKYNGHYDSSNVNNLAFYASDYLAARKSNTAALPIVNADKDITKLIEAFSKAANNSEYIASTIYSMFIKQSDIHVLRSTEPALQLKYREHSCDAFSPHVNPALAQRYRKCLDAQAQMFGTRRHMSQFVLHKRFSKTKTVS